MLKQAGLLPEYLPFPYSIAGAAVGKTFEYKLPIGGVETAQKLEDENGVVSNEMFGFEVREMDK